MLMPSMKLQSIFGDREKAEKIATWALKNPEEFWPIEYLINSVSKNGIKKEGVGNPPL